MIFWLSGSSICYFPLRARWLRSIGRTCPLSAGITSVGTGHGCVRRRAALQRNPSLSYRLSIKLSQQIVCLRSRLLVTAYGDIRQRLIERLATCLRDYNHHPVGRDAGANLKLNTEILSQMVGCSSRSLHPQVKLNDLYHQRRG